MTLRICESHNIRYVKYQCKDDDGYKSRRAACKYNTTHAQRTDVREVELQEGNKEKHEPEQWERIKGDLPRYV